LPRFEWVILTVAQTRSADPDTGDMTLTAHELLQAEMLPAGAAEPSAADISAIADRLAEALAATAAARDAAGGHAAHERSLIRDSGLLRLTVPCELGGWGADWVQLLQVVRRLAQADSALAHVFAFHHLQLASVQLYGTPDQQRRLQSQTVQQGWFWGNAGNPRDDRLRAAPVPGGWRLDGLKSYASGSVGSDQLLVSAHATAAPGGAGELLIAAVPTRAPGVRVQEDWNSFGQRQTDSGTVHFDGVLLPAEDVLLAPGQVRTTRQSLRTLLSQSIMANLYTGIAAGALQAARAFSLGEARPWFDSSLPRLVDDPIVQHRYGQLQLQLWPAQLATDAAAQVLWQAQLLGPALTAADRGHAAIAVAQAKVLGHRAAVEVSSQLFELTGAAATARGRGLDRYWRNARVHTLHDPVDLKLRDIGRHLLDGVYPEPTAYS
jgi:alkylation response protein AidB-like acyl-CoA dehydrogenase